MRKYATFLLSTAGALCMLGAAQAGMRDGSINMVL